MLRDRLVCGVHDRRIQLKLLSDTKLTFKTAFAAAQAVEIADQQVKALQGVGAEKTDEPVNKVDDRDRYGSREQTCYRCGGMNHRQADCRFKGAKCHECGKVGHIARACRTRGRAGTPVKQKNRSSRSGSTHLIEKEESDEAEPNSDGEYEPLYNLNKVSNARRKVYTTRPTLNGVVLEMEVDTGAARSLISEATYRQLWSRNDQATPPLKVTQVKLRTYTGQSIEVLGSIDVTVRVNGQIADLSLLVVAGSGPSLLGIDWLDRL